MKTKKLRSDAFCSILFVVAVQPDFNNTFRCVYKRNADRITLNYLYDQNENDVHFSE